MQTFELVLWRRKGNVPCTCPDLPQHFQTFLNFICLACLPSEPKNLSLWWGQPKLFHKTYNHNAQAALADLFMERFVIGTIFSSWFFFFSFLFFESLNPVKQVGEMVVQFYTWGNSQNLWLANWWAAQSEHKTLCPEWKTHCPLWLFYQKKSFSFITILNFLLGGNLLIGKINAIWCIKSYESCKDLKIILLITYYLHTKYINIESHVFIHYILYIPYPSYGMNIMVHSHFRLHVL